MKTLTRKRIGAALLATSLLVGVALPLCGIALLSVEGSHNESRQGDGSFVTSVIIDMHGPLVVLLIAGVIGILLLVLPGHEKPNA